MKKIMVNISEAQDKMLRDYCEKTGYTMAEIIRRGIDLYLKEVCETNIDGYKIQIN